MLIAFIISLQEFLSICVSSSEGFTEHSLTPLQGCLKTLQNHTEFRTCHTHPTHHHSPKLHSIPTFSISFYGTTSLSCMQHTLRILHNTCFIISSTNSKPNLANFCLLKYIHFFPPLPYLAWSLCLHSHLPPICSPFCNKHIFKIQVQSGHPLLETPERDFHYVLKTPFTSPFPSHHLHLLSVFKACNLFPHLKQDVLHPSKVQAAAPSK